MYVPTIAPLRFSIPVPEEMMIQSIMYADCLGDLFLLYQVSDMDVGDGMMVRLGRPSFPVKWQTEIPGFNTCLSKDFLLVFTPHIDDAPSLMQYHPVGSQNSFAIPSLIERPRELLASRF
jgi:hypothetical protein